VIRRFGYPLIFIALLGLCGGHWWTAQGVAWVGMVQDYSAHTSLVRAVGMTISGEFPCTMCAKIVESKKQETQSELGQCLKAQKDFIGAALIQLKFSPDFFPAFFWDKTAHYPAPYFDRPTPPPRLG
jgi:hypothetical protein